MDHQWRPMPMAAPQQGNICPICSIDHFPFCPPYPHPPPPPLFNQNPQFPPPPDYPRPNPYHAHAPPYPSNTIDGWQRNPGYQYGGGFGPPMYDCGNSNSSFNGYVEAEADRSYKRARVDESSQIQGKILTDDERRLKLIRDHGGNSFESYREKNADFDGNNRFQNEVSGSMYSPFQPNNEAQNQIKGAQYSQMNNWQEHRPLQAYGMPDTNSIRNEYQAPGRLFNGRPPVVSQFGASNSNENRMFSGQPPLPATPPPPLPMEPPLPSSSAEFKAYSSPPETSFSLFPVPINMSGSNSYLKNKHASTGFGSEEWQTSSQYLGEGFLPKQLSPDKPIVVDASHLFKQPHKATRPDHIVVILRGLPGSGKSYLAKMMRDLEVENGGDAPRIHSMDDYFMTEVEKVDESEGAKSSGPVRGKKLTMKKVMEYCYEPEMEEAYRDSMLKAFKKTLEEGSFKLVIVDDRNLRVADFAQFWAIAKRSCYEAYILEAAYKDPAGCAARNVHGFTLDEIQKMARLWEEAPFPYLQLDIKSLFHVDDLKKSGILEVDMDTEDGDLDNNPPGSQERMPEKTTVLPSDDDILAHSKDDKKWDADEDHPTGVKELGKSKWSEDPFEDDTEGSHGVKGNVNALSGLIQAYAKGGKSVHWSDQVANTGFSIGATKKANMTSLVIGPGAGYNLKSNPLPEEEKPAASTKSVGMPRRHSIFQERLRAERESFKVVFDKRRQRIGVLDIDEES